MTEPLSPQGSPSILRNAHDRTTLIQFCTFACVGAIGTFIHYLVLIFFVQLVKIDPVISSTFGFIAGAFMNYSLNYRYTFKSSQKHAKTMARFFLIALLGMFINMGIMHVLVHQIHLFYLLAQVLSTILVLFWNFILNKFWTFNQG